MTSNGLSRRRVPAGSSSLTSGADDDGVPATPKGSRGSSNVTTNGVNGTLSPTAVPPSQHAGSAFEGGSKIAFDPRDLERDNEDQRQGGRIPRLTIMEEVLLLGLKDKQVNFFIYLFRGYLCISVVLADVRWRACLLFHGNHDRALERLGIICRSIPTRRVCRVARPAGHSSLSHPSCCLHHFYSSILILGLSIVLERQHFICLARLYLNRTSAPPSDRTSQRSKSTTQSDIRANRRGY